MKDQSKTKQVPIQELDTQRMRIAELEQLELERKRASEVLRESEEYFKAIIQNSSDIIFILDKLGTITYASPSIERFLGYEPEEVIGKRTLDLIVSEDKPKAIADFGRALLTKEVPIPNVFRIRHKNGTEHVLEGIGNNLLDNPIVAGFVMNVRDITERKQAESALRESEERYRELTDFLPISISTFEVDAAGSIISYNRTALETFRYNEEDFKAGMNALQFFAPEEWQRVGEHMGKVIQGTSTPGQEFTFLRKDGSKFIGLIYAALNIQQNKTVGIRGVIIDITDRKRTEEELRMLASRNEAILAAVPDIIMEVDGCKRYTWANQAGLQFFGEDVVGREASYYFEEEQETYNKAQPLFDGVEDVIYIESWQRRKDGEKRLLSWWCKVLKDKQGLVAGALSTARDITELKRVEKSLFESEERYRALVDNASDIVFKTDETGHFTFVNPAGIRITGYKEEEIIGKHYPTWIRPDMRDEAIKFFGRQFVKGIQNTYSEYPILTKEGHEVWLGQNTQLIVEDGHVIGFQAVARDITKRKEVEALLRKSENRYRELSIIDDLTRLYNSRHFYQQLKMEIDRVNRYGQPLTLLLLDLDDFKQFNDTYGHIEGDQVLSRFGQVVKRCLRQTDSAYRYGGEEFTILLPMTTSGDGAVTAERIRAELKEEIFSPVSGNDVYITVSIGLAQYKSQEDMKAFVNRVDQLMYQAKKNGKDRVCSESY